MAAADARHNTKLTPRVQLHNCYGNPDSEQSPLDRKLQYVCHYVHGNLTPLREGLYPGDRHLPLTSQPRVFRDHFARSEHLPAPFRCKDFDPPKGQRGPLGAGLSEPPFLAEGVLSGHPPTAGSWCG